MWTICPWNKFEEKAQCEYVLNFLKYRANAYRYVSDVSHLSRGRAKVDYDDVLTDDETMQLINLFS